MTSEPQRGRPRDDHELQELEFEADSRPNWPGAIVMIAFFITVVIVCGICTWGVVELGGVKI